MLISRIYPLVKVSHSLLISIKKLEKKAIRADTLNQFQRLCFVVFQIDNKGES